MKKRALQVGLFLPVLLIMGLCIAFATGEPAAADPTVIVVPAATLKACIPNAGGTTCSCMCVSDTGGGIFVDLDKPAAGCSSLNGGAC